jgi:hypothetical protein
MFGAKWEFSVYSQMRNVGRDIVLLVLLAVLVVLAILPSPESEKSPKKTTASINESSPPPIQAPQDKSPSHVQDSLDEQNIMIKVQDVAESMEKRNLDADRAFKGFAPLEELRKFEPVLNQGCGEGALWPVVAGSVWTYQVAGPHKIVPYNTWTIRIISEPTEKDSGLVEAGFGDRVEQWKLRKQKGSLQFDGLPFVEPLELMGSKPVEMEGEFLPNPKRVIEDAVWAQRLTRHVMYSMRDKKGKIHKSTAIAKQRDRAQAGKFEPIVVPAGRFGAHRVDWLSRIEVTTEGRPILEHLTTEPYRKESMWIAPGIGIVKRQIDYQIGMDVKQSIIFQLMSYHSVDDCTRVESQ